MVWFSSFLVAYTWLDTAVKRFQFDLNRWCEWPLMTGSSPGRRESVVNRTFQRFGPVYMRGGTGHFSGTGRCPGPQHVYVSIVFIAYCLYGGGMFFVPSRLAGIPVSVTGIPA